MSTDVLYELTGVANGAPLRLTGKGAVDEAAGTYDLDIDIESFPMGWDPAMVILICCDRMLGFGARETSGAMNLRSRCGDDYTILDRSGEGRVRSGRTLFRARASSTGGVEDGKLFHRSQIHEATLNLLPEERITTIATPYHAIVRPLSDAALLLTTTFKFATTLENDCYGFTNYPIVGSSVKSLAPSAVEIVTIDDVSFKTKFARKGAGSISIHMRSSIRVVSI